MYNIIISSVAEEELKEDYIQEWFTWVVLWSKKHSCWNNNNLLYPWSHPIKRCHRHRPTLDNPSLVSIYYLACHPVTVYKIPLSSDRGVLINRRGLACPAPLFGRWLSVILAHGQMSIRASDRTLHACANPYNPATTHCHHQRRHGSPHLSPNHKSRS